MFKDHKVEKIKLSFGGMLFNIIVPDLPLSIASLWLKAGSRFDPAGKEGLAHFFEHLLTTKTKKYPDRKERLKALESKGIFSNAYTTKEAAYYYQIQLPGEIYDSLNFLIDGVNNTIFYKNDIEKEKNVIINEYLLNKNDPERFIWQLSVKGLFPLSDMGRNLFGDEQSIKSVTLKDISNFKEKYYQSHNQVYVVIGNESTKKLKKFIEEHYRNLKKIQKIGDQEANIFKEPQFINIDKRKTNQITIAVNYKTTSIKNFEEIIVLDIIKEYLANNWISKLIEKLRIEKDITYWVEGNNEYFSDAGFLNFIFSIKPEKLKESLSIFFKEIDKVKTKEIKKKDLDCLKISYESKLVRNLLDPYQLLWWYGYPALFGGQVINPDDYLKVIKKIRPDNILKTARKFLNKKNLSISLVGSVKSNDVKYIKRLNFATRQDEGRY